MYFQTYFNIIEYSSDVEDKKDRRTTMKKLDYSLTNSSDESNDNFSLLAAEMDELEKDSSINFRQSTKLIKLTEEDIMAEA